jgi:hypothetical protein
MQIGQRPGNIRVMVLVWVICLLKLGVYHEEILNLFLMLALALSFNNILNFLLFSDLKLPLHDLGVDCVLAIL